MCHQYAIPNSINSGVDQRKRYRGEVDSGGRGQEVAKSPDLNVT